MELAIVPSVKEMPTPAFLPPQRMIALQGEKRARTNATHTDHDLIAIASRVYAQWFHDEYPSGFVSRPQ